MSFGVKRKQAYFGHKIKVDKMKIKVCNVNCFNNSFIKRARAIIFELHEGTIYNFVKQT